MRGKVRLFEEKWSHYIGVKHSIFVNSGTSANYLAFYILRSKLLSHERIKPGDEVITTPVTFPTSVYPIINMGAIPVFVDIELETLNINPALIEDAISEKTKAIVPVHFMGHPADMESIMEIAERHNLLVIEDVSEAHGSMIGGRKTGSFGDMGIFSFFFSHHISTIEGGALTTNNDEYNDIGRIIRSYGWIRTLDENRRREIEAKYPYIDPRHLYVEMGFNFKPTEINAALGLYQIDRIEDIVEGKRANANYLRRKLSNIPYLEDYILLPKEKKGYRHVWLGFPIVLRDESPFNKLDAMNFLEERGIETRQLEAGNVLQQPFMEKYKYRVHGSTDNSVRVMNKGLFFGVHHVMSKEDLDYIVQVFEELVATLRKKENQSNK
ncbi:MAG: DegT/DnrJ/EryC1/StrS family aminotransferase [Desulfurococcales archaeon]|nr:DegT/DnrJ/EryC1/StrS family aminotransferase [Desulfurococcales archaeon]